MREFISILAHSFPQLTNVNPTSTGKATKEYFNIITTTLQFMVLIKILNIILLVLFILKRLNLRVLENTV
jgi:hypothetical protein